MKSGNVHLSPEEQMWLMEQFEVNDPQLAAESFIMMMVEERLDPEDINLVIKKIMRKMAK